MLKSAWCSRGCFGKRLGQEEISSLSVREAVSGRGRAKRRFKEEEEEGVRTARKFEA